MSKQPDIPGNKKCWRLLNQIVFGDRIRAVPADYLRFYALFRVG